jgi:hypothetical protein
LIINDHGDDEEAQRSDGGVPDGRCGYGERRSVEDRSVRTTVVFAKSA